jgi:hypothetical protein
LRMLDEQPPEAAFVSPVLDLLSCHLVPTIW